jgi:hypothetical protein
MRQVIRRQHKALSTEESLSVRRPLEILEAARGPVNVGLNAPDQPDHFITTFDGFGRRDGMKLFSGLTLKRSYHGRLGSSLRASLKQPKSRIAPIKPNEQSINRQPQGIWRNSPQINAVGMTSRQAIMPAFNTQMFRTGSRKGPLKNTAKTMCAKASQSVP